MICRLCRNCGAVCGMSAPVGTRSLCSLMTHAGPATELNVSTSVLNVCPTLVGASASSVQHSSNSVSYVPSSITYANAATFFSKFYRDLWFHLVPFRGGHI